MKHINLLFICIISLIIGLTSCNNNYDDPIINAPSEIIIDFNSTNTIILEGNIVIDSKDAYDKVTFTCAYINGETTLIEDNNISNINYSFQYSVGKLEAKEGLKEIIIYVKTSHKKEAYKTVNVIDNSSLYDDPVITVPTEIAVNIYNLDVIVLEGSIITDENDYISTLNLKMSYENGMDTWLHVHDVMYNHFDFSFTGDDLLITDGLYEIIINVRTKIGKSVSKTIKVNLSNIFYEYPSINTPYHISIDLFYMDNPVLTGNITIDEKDEFEKVIFTYNYENGDVTVHEYINIEGTNYQFSLTANDIDAKEGMTNINIYVKTINNQVNTKNISVEIISLIILHENEFTWQRSGANQGTGLEQFGLEWNSNVPSNYGIVCKITPLEGTKLVEITENGLSGTDIYLSIINLNNLKQKVDAISTSLTSFEKISADISQNYDYLLATKVGEDYFLIHITNCNVDIISTTRTITGNYKYAE